MPAYSFKRKGNATVDGPRCEEHQQRERSARLKAACVRSFWRFSSPSSRGRRSPQQRPRRGFVLGPTRPELPLSRSTASEHPGATSAGTGFLLGSTRTGRRHQRTSRRPHICVSSRRSCIRRCICLQLVHRHGHQLELCRLEDLYPTARGDQKAVATTTVRTIQVPGRLVSTRSFRALGRPTGEPNTQDKLETQHPLNKTKSQPTSRVRAGCLTGSTASKTCSVDFPGL